MEIEEGEFVRIDSDFRLIALGIGEVIKINQDTIYVKMNLDLPISLKTENITKHSKNIIDLIEVGDYVNGKYVSEIKEYKDGKTILALIGIIDEKDIKTILTKEQYQANCYTVERKEE